MRRAAKPLDPEAVRRANEAVAAETGGRPLTMGPEDAEARKRWMDAYAAAGGAVVEDATRRTSETLSSPSVSAGKRGWTVCY